MEETAQDRIERREFLKNVSSTAVAAALLGFERHAVARVPVDTAHIHNMLVVGKKAAYLSHLPMFEKLNPRGTEYTSPHRYQVILEVGASRTVRTTCMECTPQTASTTPA